MIIGKYLIYLNTSTKIYVGRWYLEGSVHQELLRSIFELLLPDLDHVYRQPKTRNKESNCVVVKKFLSYLLLWHEKILNIIILVRTQICTVDAMPKCDFVKIEILKPAEASTFRKFNLVLIKYICLAYSSPLYISSRKQISYFVFLIQVLVFQNLIVELHYRRSL